MFKKSCHRVFINTMYTALRMSNKKSFGWEEAVGSGVVGSTVAAASVAGTKAYNISQWLI